MNTTLNRLLSRRPDVLQDLYDYTDAYGRVTQYDLANPKDRLILADQYDNPYRVNYDLTSVLRMQRAAAPELPDVRKSLRGMAGDHGSVVLALYCTIPKETVVTHIKLRSTYMLVRTAAGHIYGWIRTIDLRWMAWAEAMLKFERGDNHLDFLYQLIRSDRVAHPDPELAPLLHQVERVLIKSSDDFVLPSHGAAAGGGDGDFCWHSVW